MHFSRHYKKVRKKWSSTLNIMTNQDHQKPTALLEIWNPEFWNIFPILVTLTYFFSLLKESLWIYKATNTARHKIRAFSPNFLMRNFFCKRRVSADFQVLPRKMYGKFSLISVATRKLGEKACIFACKSCFDR